ncbi:ATP-binding protein [uncultured Thiothrix sp.]|uniref:ATP-binding protein n=1 Tax=uncultured Thiothrix sp. TaxID=223185 RepID=UPI002635B0B5|nr:ATP-binding protein [uncultured Thiothrix sp.]
MPSFSIRTKLFIAILLACSIAVTAALSFVHFQFRYTYLEFVRQQETEHLQQLKTTLITYYAKQGTWDKLKKDRRQWFLLQRSLREQTELETNDLPPAPSINRLTQFDVRRRTVLLDAAHQLVQGIQLKDPPDLEYKLEWNQQVVGYLGLYQRTGFNESSEDAKFLEKQNKTLFIIALMTLLGSMLVAFLLARQLVRPIQRLRHSTSELADGNYTTRIAEVGGDELGQLSSDFNQLAQRLQQNEQARRQWIQDIAHELRTPLSILRGEIEAIQDGINPADEPTIHSLHQEALHLQRLVEDLYTLSMSDSGALSYHKTEVDLIKVLKDSLSQFEHSFQEAGLRLAQQLPTDQQALIQADEQRLQQLFHNLLKNTLRYTDSPGQLQVELKTQGQVAEISFCDTAPSVPNEALPHLFERLFRVENSRNRLTGGAGIGLSICHNIVEAHSGSMQADHSPLGGLQITIQLPLKTLTKKANRG